jgi:hypothetical protein
VVVESGYHATSRSDNGPTTHAPEPSQDFILQFSSPSFNETLKKQLDEKLNSTSATVNEIRDNGNFKFPNDEEALEEYERDRRYTREYDAAQRYRYLPVLDH